jgi:2-phosphosulfolactate phosphatase
MDIRTYNGLAGAAQAHGLVVIIDVFRAFTTACYVLAQRPTAYLLAGGCTTARRLGLGRPDTLLIGKPEPGSDLVYDIPNSPTRALSIPIRGRTVIHRTAAGARGVLAAQHADAVLVAGFANAAATVRYIQALSPAFVSLVAMGHEGTTPALEDDLCAACLAASLTAEPFDLTPHLASVRQTSGAYFVGSAQDEYPVEDFDRCLTLDSYPYALRAEQFGVYARISRAGV